ncbi:MAG: hypothetical protein JWL59_3356 [Chthoniobacteraceae bacterium]|nr:hypothetical protein [Chthoniobacteraceae bacterium]
MQPALRLVRQIREALASDWNNAPLESLAADYARLCQEANQRLESCAAMLEKGSEYQALQLAESEPVLLDLIATLSFAELPEWSACCLVEQLTMPPRFDTKAVQALDRVYAKGISASHPLYKDYRAAITLRDDAKAIHIIRSIARLNPGDANAASELARIENKLFQRKLQELRAALPQTDENTIFAILSELERLAEPTRFTELPEYVQASGMRRKAARNEAIAVADRLIEALDEERTAGAWRMVGDLLARLRTLQSEHDFTLTDAQLEKCSEMQSYVNIRRSEVDEAARFSHALSALSRLAESVDSRLLTRSTLALGEAQTLSGELSRCLKEVENFQHPIPENVAQSVRVGVDALGAEIDRLQRQRRVRLSVAGTAVLVALALASWFAIGAFRTRDYAAQLAGLRAAGQVEAAEKMIVRIQKNDAALAKKPQLAAGMDETDRWARDERTKLAEIQARLADLEGTLKDATADPVALAARLEFTGQLIEAVAVGLRSEPSGRILALRTHFEARLLTLRESLVGQAELELTGLENLAGTKLGYDQPKEGVAQALETIEPALKLLEGRMKSAVAALELPSGQQARVVALRKRTQLFREELNLLAGVHEAVLQATTLEGYLQALAGYKASRLSESAEVANARGLLAAFPKADDLLASLLLPGDPSGWAAAKADTSGPAFTPSNVLPEEISRLVALRDDNYLNDIWEITFVDFRRKNERRELYSRGDLKKEGPNQAGDVQTTRWIGAIYDPAFKTETPAFAATTYTSQRSSFGVNGDGEVSAKRLSAGSDCLNRLELNRMTDADGLKFERPLLRVFDELLRDKSASPLFKGYLMQQLGVVINVRRYPWGLEYCASLRADLEELNRLCDGAMLRSQDWLLERKRSQFNSKLSAFFARLQTRSYLAEARLNRERVRAGLKSGLQFGGFIDSTAQAHVLGEARNEKSLWVLAAGTGELTRYILPDAAGQNPRPPPAIFSPILFVAFGGDSLLPAATGRSAIPSAIQHSAILEAP